ncbi:MAG: ATP-binding cassette domain-containing protein [Burkholderiales bacterium]|nr:ATP-binding cassette domain-containing protein [Burkholderiales bacterium]
MPLLTLNQASLAFGHRALLDRVDFQLDSNERVGLIGRNGGGKSSLLKILAQQIALDDGKLWLDSNLRIGYVPQEPLLNGARTVFEQIAEGVGSVRDMLLAYHALSHAFGESDADHDALMPRLNQAQAALEHEDGWSVNARIEGAITRLALPADALISSLSGGQKKRVALGQALVMAPDVLLLDEPTNHLDLAAIDWLEELLKSFAGTVLFVTHDRRFLDNVATRIVELDRGDLRDYPGSFQTYQRVKAAQWETELAQNQKFDKLLAQEEVWIRKGIEARRTRNEGRVRRLEALRREREQRRNRAGKVTLALDQGAASGKLVAELRHVSKSFGEPPDEKRVITDFSTRIQRGDKFGLIGPNGAGKTTLLKLILGDLQPDEGSVRRGTNLSTAYFDQFREQLDDNATLTETISQGAEFVEVDGRKKHVISYLGDFLFAPERARAKVSALSGGERNRLLLARLFTRPANVLVLDEPTNDLDIETLELLESLLQEYSGTLFLVSHDRAFLDNVVTQVIAFEGDGKLIEYVGGYADWQRIKQSQASEPRLDKAPAAGIKSRAKPATERAKLSHKETRELESLPARIQALEDEQRAITEQLTDADLYRSQAEKVARLRERFGEIEEELTAGLARWEALEARQSASAG